MIRRLASTTSAPPKRSLGWAASRGMTVADATLYTNSTLALHAQTGEIAWHFQHAPGETIDM